MIIANLNKKGFFRKLHLGNFCALTVPYHDAKPKKSLSADLDINADIVLGHTRVNFAHLAQDFFRKLHFSGFFGAYCPVSSC